MSSNARDRRSAPRRRAAVLATVGLPLTMACSGLTRRGESAAEPVRPELSSTASATAASAGAVARRPRVRRVIVFVWDGLRPDFVRPDVTPRLAALRDHDGVNFQDQHATYPSVTMMNAASLATGAYAETHGFFGNTVYMPGPAGNAADGSPIDFDRPLFTEDYGVLSALDRFERRERGGALLRSETLADAAHAAGLKTAIIGKSGPAFIQDYREDGSRGVILDENMAFPRSFAEALLAAGFPLPKGTAKYPYPDGAVALPENNGDPTATTTSALVKLSDGTTPDPRSDRGSPYSAKNEYLMRVFREYVLPRYEPDLSIVWLRNPDSTEHNFGPGSPDVVAALKSQDALLGLLMDQLAAQGIAKDTDVIVMSDHGHSTVAGDEALFPLRRLVGAPDGTGSVDGVDAHGYSVSGTIRSAALLTRAGLTHVYDGSPCMLQTALAGTRADGKPLYPEHIDRDGKVCGKPGTKYSTGSFVLPGPLPKDAIVIAPNGGSEYFYVPGHDEARVRELVRRLQEQTPYGAVFVRSPHAGIPGTLPLALLRLEGPGSESPPTPDVVASFDYDDGATVAGVVHAPGIEYASALDYRGMHGSSSPVDIHSTLIATGPDFKSGFSDTYPTATVDVAPTVAKILGLSLPRAAGRVLDEAFAGSTVSYRVTQSVERSTEVRLARFCRADDPDCKRPLAGGSYGIAVDEKTLASNDGRRYVYIDRAKARRSPK